MTILPEVSIIIPARNEELNIARCLASLVRQREVAFEILVVIDHSTDRTADIARSFAGVSVLEAPAIPFSYTGKVSAMRAGVNATSAAWIIFTDADTVHSDFSLRHSLNEVKECQVDFLSYSPRQELGSFWERAVQPVVFAELSSRFSYTAVNDPSSRDAAANGQCILIARKLYSEIGGHGATGLRILEDVELARSAKRVSSIRFRYAPEAVTTRMYTSRRAIVEGWTRNLADLFPDALWIAFKRCIEFVLLLASPILSIALLRSGDFLHVLLLMSFVLLMLSHFAMRISKAGYSFWRLPETLVGLPFFSCLLIRSWFFVRVKRVVAWKGRCYPTDA